MRRVPIAGYLMCEKCGEVFDFADEREDVLCYIDDRPYTETVLLCPYCGCSDLTENIEEVDDE